MRRFLLYLAAAAICALTVLAIYRADKNTKRVAGFLDSSVFFDVSKDEGGTVLTILNEKITLR